MVIVLPSLLVKENETANHQTGGTCGELLTGRGEPYGVMVTLECGLPPGHDGDHYDIVFYRSWQDPPIGYYDIFRLPFFRRRTGVHGR